MADAVISFPFHAVAEAVVHTPSHATGYPTTTTTRTLDILLVL